MNIGKSIEIMLIRKGWSKGDLAKKLGASRSTVSTLCGNPTCGGSMLQKLAGVFGMEVSDFIAVGEDK